MIRANINGVAYDIKNDWADITIEEAGRVLSIPIPAVLKKSYDVSYQNMGLPTEEYNEKMDAVLKEITLEEQHKTIPLYFLQVLEVLSNIPKETLDKTDVTSIKAVYHTYLKQIVEGLLYSPNYKPQDITFFEFEGKKYLLPENREIFGQAVPMVALSALEFTESADLMIHLSAMNRNRDFTRIANLISILCRPAGERYDEAVCVNRAEKFKRLRMNTVWDVFFSLIAPLIILNQCVLIASLERAAGRAMN